MFSIHNSKKLNINYIEIVDIHGVLFMQNVPHFTRKQVLALAQFYDYMNREENLNEQDILNKAKDIKDADQLFSLIVSDKNSILRWKGASRIKRYFQDTEYWTPTKKNELYLLIKQLSCNPLKNKDIVAKLADYRGISFPLASTIAFFFSQQNCPIIDVRAVETLKKYGYKVIDNYDWNAYFDICYNLKTELGVSFRELDKALWIYSNVEECIEKYKMLHELGLVPLNW
jgi:hypothetical protein